MDNPQIEKAIERIVTLQERLCHCENDQQYIRNLNTGYTNLMNCWKTDLQENMHQFMKAISVPVADSLFMKDFVILFRNTNMGTDRLKKYQYIIRCGISLQDVPTLKIFTLIISECLPINQ